jgi:hypothetical protein
MAIEGLSPGTGTALGTLAMPGVGTAIGAGVDLLSFGVGTYFNERARSRQLKTLEKERQRQIALEAENRKLNRSTLAFNQRFQRQQFKLGAEAQRFNQDQVLEANRISRFDRFMNNMMNQVSTDASLKDRFIQKGYI